MTHEPDQAGESTIVDDGRPVLLARLLNPSAVQYRRLGVCSSDDNTNRRQSHADAGSRRRADGRHGTDR